MATGGGAPRFLNVATTLCFQEPLLAPVSPVSVKLPCGERRGIPVTMIYLYIPLSKQSSMEWPEFAIMEGAGWV